MPVPSPDDPDLVRAALVTLEQRVTVLTLAVERQNVQIGRIADLLADLRNRYDWNAAQVGELLRILATGMREIRETQVYSLVDDGPLTVAELLQLQSLDREHQEARQSIRLPCLSIA